MGTRVPVPHCAVCNGPVGELTCRGTDPLTGGVTFVARCHGEEEETTFTRRDLEAGPMVLLPGVAFRERED